MRNYIYVPFLVWAVFCSMSCRSEPVASLPSTAVLIPLNVDQAWPGSYYLMEHDGTRGQTILDSVRIVHKFSYAGVDWYKFNSSRAFPEMVIRNSSQGVMALFPGDSSSYVIFPYPSEIGFITQSTLVDPLLGSLRVETAVVRNNEIIEAAHRQFQCIRFRRRFVNSFQYTDYFIAPEFGLVRVESKVLDGDSLVTRLVWSHD